MKSWQQIMSEQKFDEDFCLDSDNSQFIVDGVIDSYETEINADYNQVKTILDSAFNNEFTLQYRQGVGYILVKQYKRGNIVVGFSSIDNYILDCSYYVGGKLFVNYPKAFNYESGFEPGDGINVIKVEQQVNWDQFLSNLSSISNRIYDKLSK